MEGNKPYQIVPEGKKAFRRDYSKVSGKLELPNLVEIQTNSYDWFTKQGIEEVFNEIFPIESFNKNIKLNYKGFHFAKPKCTPQEAMEKECNYAASLVAGEKAHHNGYSVMLYLDPKEKKYLDECGAANFFGIKDNTYITPNSETVLPSITNKSLTQLATDLGMTVERRPITIDELESFEECSACGTAAVCSPIGQIDDLETGKVYTFGEPGVAGKMTKALYDKLRGIQYGEEPDTHGWCEIIESEN